jgi:hypothetical protein
MRRNLNKLFRMAEKGPSPRQAQNLYCGLLGEAYDMIRFAIWGEERS